MNTGTGETHATYDLERLITDLEFENQQYVKQIECERQEISSMETQLEECKVLIKYEQEVTPQLDDAIKQYHRQYTHNRDNIQNVKQTLCVLRDHEDAVTKRLQMMKDKHDEERKENEQLLQHYEEKWTRYKGCYDSFPKAKELENAKNEIASLEQNYKECSCKKSSLEQELRQLQQSSGDEYIPESDTTEFIITLAELYVKQRNDAKAAHDLEETYKNACEELQALHIQREQERERREKEEKEQQQKIEEERRKQEEENRRKQEEERQKIEEQERLRAMLNDRRQRQLQEIMTEQVKVKKREAMAEQVKAKQREISQVQQAARLNPQICSERNSSTGVHNVPRSRHQTNMQSTLHNQLPPQNISTDRVQDACSTTVSPVPDSSRQSRQSERAGQAVQIKPPVSAPPALISAKVGQPSTAARNIDRHQPPPLNMQRAAIPMLAIPPRQFTRPQVAAAVHAEPPRSTRGDWPLLRQVQELSIQRQNNIPTTLMATSPIVPKHRPSTTPKQSQQPAVLAQLIKPPVQNTQPPVPSPKHSFPTMKPISPDKIPQTKTQPESESLETMENEALRSPENLKKTMPVELDEHDVLSSDIRMEETAPIKPIEEINSVISGNAATTVGPVEQEAVIASVSPTAQAQDEASPEAMDINVPQTPARPAIPMEDDDYSDYSGLKSPKSRFGQRTSPSNTPGLSFSPLSDSSLDLDKALEKVKKFRAKSPGAFNDYKAFFQYTASEETSDSEPVAETTRDGSGDVARDIRARPKLFGAGDATVKSPGFRFPGDEKSKIASKAFTMFGDDDSDAKSDGSGFNFTFGSGDAGTSGMNVFGASAHKTNPKSPICPPGFGDGGVSGMSLFGTPAPKGGANNPTSPPGFGAGFSFGGGELGGGGNKPCSIFSMFGGGDDNQDSSVKSDDTDEFNFSFGGAGDGQKRGASMFSFF